MLKYKGTFIRLFPLFMRKYLREQYGDEITAKALKRAPGIYKDMLAKCDDIGADNPMAGNIYMCFVFMAIWKGADGEIDVDSYRKVIRDFITKSVFRKFIGKNDMNSPDGIEKGRAKMISNKQWIEEHPQYKDKSWDINIDDDLHKDGYYFYFTRCPINSFARKYGFLEVLPACCEIDHLLTEASHGRLIREYTLAKDGDICDYWIVPDKIKDPK